MKTKREYSFSMAELQDLALRRLVERGDVKPDEVITFDARWVADYGAQRVVLTLEENNDDLRR